MDYHSYGTKLVTNNPDARTVCTTIEGQRIWFKQPVPPKARVWHKIQKFLAGTINHPILRVTVSNGGASALRAEAQRLIEFKERGFHAPEVLAVYDDMIVMTDAGPQLRAYLDQLQSYDERLTLLKTTMQEMARLHQSGLAHGRPYMRDMTWDGEKIGFLDLEEDPLKVMPLSTAQARDVWIFISAASRYARRAGCKNIYEGDLVYELYDEYARSANEDTLKELRSFVLFLKPIRKVLDNKILWNHIGRDARQSVFVNRCLESCFK